MDKKATREGYGDGLVALAEVRPDLVVLDPDLAAATKTSIFRKAYPEKHFECGIAEQNMMGVAAGIASTGKLVFASSFAMFATGRAYEIVRNSIGYPGLNVKIGGTHGGISVGEDGASHKFISDGVVSAIAGTASSLGTVWYGTTPEERSGDLAKGTLSIVNTGVSIYTYTTEHPVNTHCVVSEIVLPSYENMDSVFVMKVA